MPLQPSAGAAGLLEEGSLLWVSTIGHLNEDFPDFVVPAVPTQFDVRQLIYGPLELSDHFPARGSVDQ